MIRRKVMPVLYLLFLAATCFLLVMENTEAATYNFFFNNTEQGANSTATPNMVVRDGITASAPGTTNESNINKQDANPDSNSNGTISTTGPQTKTPIDNEPRSNDPNWKFSAGASRIHFINSDDCCSDWYSLAHPPGLQVSVSFFPKPYLGLNLSAGRVFGAEIELSPTSLSKKWGHVYLSGSLGLFKATNGWLDRFAYATSSLAGPKGFAVYAGAKAEVNILPNVSLGFAGRLQPIKTGSRTSSIFDVMVSYVL